MEIITKIHTIFLLIGPSGCGKTEFTEKVLIPQLKKYNALDLPKTLNIQYLSSDDIRRNLLDGSEKSDQNSIDIYSKSDNRMLMVSKHAFEMLLTKLKIVTSYPINAEFVILDTMGLSDTYRNEVISIAEQNNYNLEAIVFDFKNINDYFIYSEKEGELGKEKISKQVDKLKLNVLKSLGRKTFNKIFKFIDRNIYDTNIKIENFDTYQEYFLNHYYTYSIIGDIHSCYDEFILLIQKNGFSIQENGKITCPEDHKLIIIGDFIDKGYADKNIIEFIYNNLEQIKIIKGNHENLTYNILTGKVSKDSIEPNLLNDYFTCLSILENDKELRNKFLTICENAREFYIGNNFIVTHSPCNNRFLGKIDNLSLKAQRYISIPQFKNYNSISLFLQDRFSVLNFLSQEAEISFPYHIFGHVPVSTIYKEKNKLGIDTGCVNGKKLTSITLFPKSNNILIKSQRLLENNRDKVKKDRLFPLFLPDMMKDVKLEELTIHEKKRIDDLVADKINFISGTMSPVKSNIKENVLESLKDGLIYYKKMGIKNVILEPKYMGSRCNIYLFDEVTGSYSVSRNGNVIKHLDLSLIYEDLYSRLRLYFKENNIKLLIIDGELLPWYALGEGLINEVFDVLSKGISSELSLLEESNFETEFNKVSNAVSSNNFIKEISTISKKNLQEKYGISFYLTFKAFLDLKNDYVPIEQLMEMYNIYKKQLDIYASSKKTLSYKGFSLLKAIHNDNTESFYFSLKNEDLFKLLNDDNYSTINIIDLDKAIALAEKYYNDTINNNMEGIVIKPEFVYNYRVAPFLKCRNPNYLTLIYGYDYLSSNKYSKLIKNKDVRGKLKASIEEWEIGKNLLEIPYNELNSSNILYKKALAKMILEENNESVLDPRL